MPAAIAAAAEVRDAPIATAAQKCTNHAGHPEGDGEYSDGAMVDAFGISCGHAFALVRPRYRWLYAHFRRAYHHGFTLGSFHCRITPDGPNDLKTCRDAGRRFDFL